MHFFNILEPRIICDDAIKAIKREMTTISIEMEKLKANNEFENFLKIQELKKLYIDYYRLIDKLEKLGDFGVQQMNKIVKGGRKGKCIL